MTVSTVVQISWCELGEGSLSATGSMGTGVLSIAGAYASPTTYRHCSPDLLTRCSHYRTKESTVSSPFRPDAVHGMAWRCFYPIRGIDMGSSLTATSTGKQRHGRAGLTDWGSEISETGCRCTNSLLRPQLHCWMGTISH